MNGLTESQELDYRAAAQIRDSAEELNVYLATWQDDDDRPGRRQALTDAIGAIDVILRMGRRCRSAPAPGAAGAARRHPPHRNTFQRRPPPLPRRRVMTDVIVRRVTAASVLLVSLIAATVSFVHIEHLAVTHGQTPLAAYLLPVSIDGTVVAASMVMLQAARAGIRTPWLARVMLGLAVVATLAAKVAYGWPAGPAWSVLSGWPAAAFIGCAEMALGMVRRATRKTSAAPVAKAAVKASPRTSGRVTGRGADAAAEAARKAVTEGQPVPSGQGR